MGHAMQCKIKGNANEKQKSRSEILHRVVELKAVIEEKDVGILVQQNLKPGNQCQDSEDCKYCEGGAETNFAEFSLPSKSQRKTWVPV